MRRGRAIDVLYHYKLIFQDLTPYFVYIAVTDEEIEEIDRLVPDKTVVEITP
jgi:hypothetical protein